MEHFIEKYKPKVVKGEYQIKPRWIVEMVAFDQANGTPPPPPELVEGMRTGQPPPDWEQGDLEDLKRYDAIEDVKKRGH